MLMRVAPGCYYLEHDHTVSFPLPDGVFEWAYSEHFIEHVAWADAVRWLGEVRRLLRPGGTLRLTTPDLSLYISGFSEPCNGFFAEHAQRLRRLGCRLPLRPAWMVNQIFYGWGHCFIYDFDEVRAVLALAGFNPDRVVRCSFQKGTISEVCLLDLPQRSDETLYVEVSR